MGRSGAVICNEDSRKGQRALTHTQETHPGRSVLLLLECTAKTFSFCWSQWYSTPEFKALETTKKKRYISTAGRYSIQHTLHPHNMEDSADSWPTETADLAQFMSSLQGHIITCEHGALHYPDSSGISHSHSFQFNISTEARHHEWRDFQEMKTYNCVYKIRLPYLQVTKQRIGMGRPILFVVPASISCAR